jgi:hypothetical protein
MMSNKHRSEPVINAYLPLDKAAESIVPIAENLKKMATITQQVMSRLICSSRDIEKKKQSYRDETDLGLLLITHRVMVKRETTKACFLSCNMKMTSNSAQNMLWQP